MGVRTYRGQIVCDKRWPDGKRFMRVCRNRTQAKALLARIEVAIADGSWREFKEKLTLRQRETVILAEFADTYMEDYAKVRNKENSWKRKITSLNSMLPFMGDRELNSITPALLHKYVQTRKRDGVSAATINWDLALIKHMLNYAVECGLLESNGVERFKLLKQELAEGPRYTEEQVQRVINAVRPDCRPLFAFVRETGCRREEALSLQNWQIQEDSRLVVFSEDTKSGKFRYVPLTEKALEAVNSLPKLEDCSYVFYNLKTGSRWSDCRKPWEKARNHAGLPDLKVKDLRRHYAIELAENGASMHDIQQVLGHASVSTTEKHYAQFSPRHSSRRILKVLEGNKRETEAETKRKHVPNDTLQRKVG